MQPGCYVIANDFLGVVLRSSGDTVTLRGADGISRDIKKKACHEITNPHALALLLYNKVLKNSKGATVST